jgi:ABC-type Fe3+-hydroxamate transport system substrate-binding protein
VIVHLMPAAAPQVRQAAMQRWNKMSQLPAVQTGRVYILDESWVLTPGSHVGDMAQKLADLLHGNAHGPATRIEGGK